MTELPAAHDSETCDPVFGNNHAQENDPSFLPQLFFHRSRFVHSFAAVLTRDSVCGAASFPSRIGLTSGVA
jgi:hypothetical protein